ncbi:MAG: ABC transporter permease [Clostridiales bacterium]|nr:ABC transporter permease [Clostridiales bacterium]
MVWHRLMQDRVAVVGMVIMILLVLISVFGRLLPGLSPNEMHLAEQFQGPSAAHWFGTDDLGRDIFARIIYGGIYSLALGFIGSVFTALIGTVCGTIIGYLGGTVDNFFMRVCDVWQAIPGQLLAIVISTTLGAGFFNTILAMSIGGIPMSIRSTRAMCLKEREMEYLEAAQSYNCSKAKIMFKHMLPNIISPTIVGTTMSMGGTIMGAAGLSYIGLGIPADVPEWGAMISAARSYSTLYPHMMIFPGMMIAIVVLAINLFGDGLRDAMDPKLKK